MADVFLSYSSKDRKRVRSIRDALAERGFSVFWDLEVPANVDWDTWIRARLSEAKCAVVIWSSHSVVSDNVRHEAAIAKQLGKAVTILLDPLDAAQLPMGFYSIQAANLTTWTGSIEDGEWRKLLNEIEERLTPRWIRVTIDALQAELEGERARREAAELRDNSLRDQIAKEAHARQDVQQQLHDAQYELKAAQTLLVKARDDSVVFTDQLSSLRATLDSTTDKLKSLEIAHKQTLTANAELRRQLDARPTFSLLPPPPASGSGWLSTANPPSVATPYSGDRKRADLSFKAFKDSIASWQRGLTPSQQVVNLTIAISLLVALTVFVFSVLNIRL